MNHPDQETHPDIAALVEALPAEVKAVIIAQHVWEESLRRSQRMKEVWRLKKGRD